MICLRKSITRICANCHAVFIARTDMNILLIFNCRTERRQNMYQDNQIEKAVTNPEAGNSWSLFYTWHHFIVDFLSSERMVFCLTCFFQTLVFSFLSWFDAERMNLLQILGAGGAWALQAVKERGRRSKGAAQACLQDKWKWHKTGTKKAFCYDSVKILRRKVQKMKC